MANVITCPKCERQLRVPDDLIGQSVKCPSCGDTFTAKVGGGSSAKVSTRGAPRPRDEAEERPSRRAARNDDDEGGGRRRQMAPHRGDTIQLLGILAFFLVPHILGPIAWIMGRNDLREMDAGRMDPAGRQATQTGKTCGMIAAIIWYSVSLVAFLVWFGMVLFVFLVYGTMACCCCGASAGGSAGGH
jgi:predicted Zn finger-like uncharacterized protein